MATKDPHIALIDAHEKMDNVKLMVRTAAALVRAKQARGEKPTEDDKLRLAAIRAEAIEQTKRIQDELYEELYSHGTLQ